MTSSLFSPLRPTPRQLQRMLAQQADQPLSYPESAASHPHRHPHLGTLPPHYALRRYGQRIGQGDEDLARARAAMSAWIPFDLPWVALWPPSPAWVPGTVFLVLGHILGVWSVNACRVLYLLDDPTHGFGLGYGTLPGHALSGEERLRLLRDPDGTLRYELFSFSRASSLLARLGSFPLREWQGRFDRESTRRMQDALRRR
ncbi:MAG: DUF1990 domain-containing protein [Magnetococcus sp. WYHC-3]